MTCMSVAPRHSALSSLNEEIIACRKCPRLVEWRESVAIKKRKAYLDQEYWGRPVPGFGDPSARVLVVGLAPGAHGSNRTGRQFTGDGSGNFLFPALHRAGFASQPTGVSRDDGLILYDMYITASARCAPPANKPTRHELDNCQPYLEREIRLLQPKVIVCLGRVAFDRLLRILPTENTQPQRPPSAASAASSGPSIVFAHGALYKFTIPTLTTDHRPLNTYGWLLCSYHPSQQNTLTGRLTVRMFDDIWATARSLLETE